MNHRKQKKKHNRSLISTDQIKTQITKSDLESVKVNTAWMAP